MAAIASASNLGPDRTAGSQVTQPKEVTTLHSVCEYGRATAGESWQQADGSFKVCASDNTTVGDIADTSIKAIKKALQAMHTEDDVKEEHIQLQQSKSVLFTASHTWMEQAGLDRQFQRPDTKRTWGIQVVAVAEPVMCAGIVQLSAKASAERGTQPSTDDCLQPMRVPVLIACNMTPWGPNFPLQQGLLRVPWEQFGLEAISANATDNQGIGMLKLNSTNSQPTTSRRSNTDNGGDKQQQWRLATLALHFTACDEVMTVATGSEAEDHTSTQQEESCKSTQRNASRSKTSTQRKPKQIQPPAKVTAALVHEAVTSVLIKLKQDTAGGFGTTPVEAKANQLLPKLATCISSIIRSANNPVLMPYACNALGCESDSLHEVLHSRLVDACLQWGVSKVHKHLEGKSNKEKLATQTNTGTADQANSTSDKDLLEFTPTDNGADGSDGGFAIHPGRSAATGALLGTEDQTTSIIADNDSLDISRSSQATTSRPVSRTGKRAPEPQAVGRPGSFDLSTAVHQVFGIKPLKRVCATDMDELDLLF